VGLELEDAGGGPMLVGNDTHSILVDVSPDVVRVLMYRGSPAMACSISAWRWSRYLDRQQRMPTLLCGVEGNHQRTQRTLA